MDIQVTSRKGKMDENFWNDCTYPLNFRANYNLIIGWYLISLTNWTEQFITLLHSIWWDMRKLTNCPKCVSRSGGGVAIPCASVLVEVRLWRQGHSSEQEWHKYLQILSALPDEWRSESKPGSGYLKKVSYHHFGSWDVQVWQRRISQWGTGQQGKNTLQKYFLLEIKW